MSFVTAAGMLEAFGARAGWLDSGFLAGDRPGVGLGIAGRYQERTVVFEHLGVQTHELLAGLQSQLGREAAASAGKRIERIGLAS